MTRVAGLAASMVCLLPLALTGAARATAGETLSIEDVVRLHVAGVGADEVIARIRAAEVDFDLSETMLEELRLAGLPGPVIQAMVDRQREFHPPILAETEDLAVVEPADAVVPGLVVKLRVVGKKQPKGDEPPALIVHNGVPQELLRQLRIEDGNARITDLAVFVVCTTATHVPDHWRTASPLGRDFEGVPRHRMLAFVAGATREDPSAAADAPGNLTLTVPESLSIELEAEQSHEIVIGVAIELGGRFYVTSRSDEHELPASGTGREIEARIVRTGPDPWSIEVVLLPSSP